MFELIINILLVAFLGFSYFTHVLEAPVPVKVQKNPYAFQPDTWPKVIQRSKSEMFELIINILLVAFLGFSYFTHVLEAPVPVKVQKNPYAFQPDTWPKVIIILLEICLIINIIQIIKRNKGKENFTLKAFIATIPDFFKSKMFVGILILAAASMLLETLGFVVTAILVLFAYGALLGEKNFLRLGIASVVIALVLYIVFSGMLSVNLPRGTVGFLRDFALFLESIVASVKGIFG